MEDEGDRSEKLNIALSLLLCMESPVGAIPALQFWFSRLLLVILPLSVFIDWGSSTFLLLLNRVAWLSCSVSLSCPVTHGTRGAVPYVQVPQEEGLFFLTDEYSFSSPEFLGNSPSTH